MEVPFYEIDDIDPPDACRKGYPFFCFCNTIFWIALTLVGIGVILCLLVTTPLIALAGVGGYFTFVSFCCGFWGACCTSETLGALNRKQTHSQTEKYLESLLTNKTTLQIYAESSHYSGHGKNRHRFISWTHTEIIEIPYMVDYTKRFKPLKEYDMTVLNLKTLPLVHFSKDFEQYFQNKKKQLIEEARGKDVLFKVVDSMVIEGTKPNLLSVDDESGCLTNLVLNLCTAFCCVCFGCGWLYHIFYNYSASSLDHYVVRYCSLTPFTLTPQTMEQFSKGKVSHPVAGLVNKGEEPTGVNNVSHTNPLEEQQQGPYSGQMTQPQGPYPGQMMQPQGPYPGQMMQPQGPYPGQMMQPQGYSPGHHQLPNLNQVMVIHHQGPIPGKPLYGYTVDDQEVPFMGQPLDPYPIQGANRNS